MNPEQLIKRLAEIVERMEALADLAKKENRGLSEDEGKEFDALEIEVKQVKRNLERAEVFEKEKAERSKATTEPVSITVTRNEHEDENGDPKVWRSFGEQMQAVIHVEKNPHSARSNELRSKIELTNKMMRAATGMNETVDADGGVHVQKDFATELVMRANHYSALLNSAHPLWKQHGSEAEAIIESLNTLKVERFRPAMLALLDSFEGKELISAMRVILNGSVRYLIAIGAGGGTLEAAWSDVARKVASKEVTTAVGFAKEMQKIVPNDEVFRTGFKSARIAKSFLARYFLASLERFARGQANCELVPNSEVSAVNLEHVLPETISDDWKGLNPEIAGAYARRIGNLVLLSSKKNSELGNQGFDKKKATLAASEFVLTKQVGETDKWGPDEIDARQSKLADMALKVWAFKS